MFAVASGCAAAEWGAGRKDAKVAVVSSRPGSRERVNNAGGKVGYVSGSQQQHHVARARALRQECTDLICVGYVLADRKSTRLNSSHVAISYAVFCLKKKN